MLTTLGVNCPCLWKGPSLRVTAQAQSVKEIHFHAAALMRAMQLQEHNHRRAGSYGAAGKEKGEGIGSLARCSPTFTSLWPCIAASSLQVLGVASLGIATQYTKHGFPHSARPGLRRGHNAVFLMHVDTISMLCACLVCKLVSKEAHGARQAPERMRWKDFACISGL